MLCWFSIGLPWWTLLYCVYFLTFRGDQTSGKIYSTFKLLIDLTKWRQFLSLRNSTETKSGPVLIYLVGWYLAEFESELRHTWTQWFLCFINFCIFTKKTKNISMTCTAVESQLHQEVDSRNTTHQQWYQNNEHHAWEILCQQEHFLHYHYHSFQWNQQDQMQQEFHLNKQRFHYEGQSTPELCGTIHPLRKE